jgi:hypothetical protein
MDLIVKISLLDAGKLNFLIERGLIEEIFKIFQTEDILVKLNAVEIISEFCDSHWNCAFISSQNVVFHIYLQEYNDSSQ